MKLIQTIKMLRKQKGFTQERLSELLGVSLMTVRRWEWGSTSPNSNMLLKLAEVFEIAPEELLAYDTDMNEMTVSLSTESSHKGKLPNMAYWGSVADNAKNVAEYGDNNDIADVTQMLLRALASLGTKDKISQPVPPVTVLGVPSAMAMAGGD